MTEFPYLQQGTSLDIINIILPFMQPLYPKPLKNSCKKPKKAPIELYNK